MTLEEGFDTPNFPAHHGHHQVHHHNQLMDWLEDSISFLPTFLNEPYSVPEDIARCDWWAQEQNQSLAISAAGPSTAALPAKPEFFPVQQSEFPQKRKLSAIPAAAQRRRIVEEFEEERKPQVSNSKKVQGRGSPSNHSSVSSGGASKEVRWAEQLLNPLAAAIDAANLSRAQHLIYVLQELASLTGDANHRLAFYGLHALARHLSSSSVPGTALPLTYASTDPRLFRSALIKFHEVSAWFAFPNCLANAAIIQAATTGRTGPGCSLQVVDVGVSHGLQWPTLIEALTRRAGTGPGLVRLKVVGSGTGGPFGSAPAGYDFAPQLLRYAKSIDLNLRVERGELKNGVGRSSAKELVVVCVQFRAGRAGAGFLRAVREMEPDMVVLSEMEEAEGEGFARRAEMVWNFLESTSVAFKGKDCEERRVVEGEAARLLEEEYEEVDGWGRERWRERMKAEGFQEEGFGEEAVEAGRALLKKYDGNWEMKVDGAVGLCWKGQPVSFCSLWKPAYNAAAGVFAAGGGDFCVGKRH